MSNHLVQLGELIPIKGIWYAVVDVVGQNMGYPEQIVLRPHSLTMQSIKKGIRENKRKGNLGATMRSLRG